jgi:hypothetical protein
VETVRIELNEATEFEREPLATLSRAVGPLVTTGVIARVRATVPVPLRNLLTVIVDGSEEPALIIRELGFAERTKVGRVMTVPVNAVSWLGLAPPLVIVIQSPGTLEPLPQTPVRKLTEVPVVAVATVYTISKRLPVVGASVSGARLTTPTSTTPGPSPEAILHPVPAPLTQLASGRMGCARRVLLRSAFAGLRIVMSVLTKMRNPFRASEVSILIPTTTLVPTAPPAMLTGLVGHPEVLVIGGAATQTTPTI